MPQRTEIVALQYLRGLCAIAVVIDHAAERAAFPKYFGVPLLAGQLANGRLGVDIFFVISGFIITVVALRGADLHPAISRASFFAKRFARILPLMWIAVLSYGALRWLVTDTRIVPLNYLRALTLWPDDGLEPPHIWTLRHECIFYLLFALSFLGRRTLRCLLALWFVSPIFFSLSRGTFFERTSGTEFLPVFFSPFNLEFAAGMFVGLLWLRRPPRSQLRLPVHPWLLFAGLTFAAMVLSVSMPTPWASVPTTLVTAILGAALVGLAALVECPQDALSAFGRLLGNASYAIYLFHPHIISASLAIASRLLHLQHEGFTVAAICLLALGIGILIHLWIEKPLLYAVQLGLGQRPRISSADTDG
jgi:exopolysaccharide production protein ExoZ